MKNMIQDIKKLVSKHSVWLIYLSYNTFVKECGHYFNINGERRLYYGTLCAVSADNPASQEMGGFKESCSAVRPS